MRTNPQIIEVTENGSFIGTLEVKDFVHYMGRPHIFLSVLIADFNKAKENRGEPERILARLRAAV